MRFSRRLGDVRSPLRSRERRGGRPRERHAAPPTSAGRIRLSWRAPFRSISPWPPCLAFDLETLLLAPWAVWTHRGGLPSPGSLPGGPRRGMCLGVGSRGTGMG
uniref:NADH dehydrogenase subunit 3 n=1 Tax=Leucosolenia complicata TaxID=433461 RepID=A0A140CUS7_9METZ|nr:NADH dehydrogenase subunit 3 [Leucosolenia complicata]